MTVKRGLPFFRLIVAAPCKISRKSGSLSVEVVAMKRKIKNEEGSATIEFLGMVPLVFSVMMIAWQFIAGFHGLMIAESAASEAAKVYSVTADVGEATNAAQNIVDAGGSYISFAGAPISGSNNFTASVSVNIDFVFLPASMFAGGKPTFSYTADTSGKVIK